MKIYTREEAIKKSMEYFEGEELPSEVFVTKYAMRNDKLEIIEPTPEYMHRRLAKEFARIEKKYPNPMSEEEIFGLFDRFKYLVPQGSPMFGIGNQYQKVSLSNCFVIDVVDSYGGICRADERIAQISKRRGGVGLDISPIRPKGLPTRNSALTTDGIVVFMERFSNTSREVAQNGRRGALMLSISVHHPEILNFIKAKRDLKKVTGANISVRVTDEFMKSVKNDKDYELRWPVDSDKPSIKSRIKAKEIWDELIKSNWSSGEPGILFWDTIIENSPSDSYVSDSFRTLSTNPCLTGDTKVYVADGRGNISIKQLADEGKDVPVFCYDNDNNIVVRKMVNPRITGYSQPIYKITLDDGCVIRCTGNHKFKLTNGLYEEAKKFKKGDSLKIITRYEAQINEVIKEEASASSQNYYWISNGWKNNSAEHRIIASYKIGRKVSAREVVHHKDHNAQNNALANLEVMFKTSHDKIHKKSMMGKNNPMVRAAKEWSKEKWQQYSRKMSKSVSGSNNGRYIEISNKEIRKHAIKYISKIGYRCSEDEWFIYCKKHNIPILSGFRSKELGSTLDLLKWAAENSNIEHKNEDPRVAKTLIRTREHGYTSFIDNGKVFVQKRCAHCSKSFIVPYQRREVSFCSVKCSNVHDFDKRIQKSIKSNLKTLSRKFSILRNKQCEIYTKIKNNNNYCPKRKEWEQECRKNDIPFRLGTKNGFKNYDELKDAASLYNHRIVSIEIDGYEDVYNGTVEEFHNFFVGAFESKTNNNKNKWVYINSKNCGELPLNNGASCILLLQNLTSYVNDPFTPNASFNEELFRINTKKSQRLIDDMVDLEIEAIEKVIEKVKNDPEDDKVKANELDLWQNIKNTCINGRRTGLGITGLGDCIAMLNAKYGSKESAEIVKKIYSIMRDEAYKSSIELAKERGPFPIWNHNKEKDNKYLNRLPDDIKKEMQKHGRRNISILTTSPAGSVSTLTQTTSGFEPVFMAEYVRKRKLTDNDKDKPDFVDQVGDKWKNYKIEHHGLKLYKKINPGKEFKDSPYFGSQANDIDYEMKVKMQGIATFYTDHAISNTVNAPKNIDIKSVDKLYMMAWEEQCKGITFYRDGSRDGVLTKEASTTRQCDECEEASKKLNELTKLGHRPAKITYSPAPKRLEIMPCEIHRSKVKKGDWLFFVGLLNGQPYEVFGGNAKKFEKSLTIPYKYKTGWILKNGKNKKTGVSQYNLVLGSLEDKNERLDYKDINKHFNNKEYGAFTRLVSLSLRHGTPIKYVCEQITKTGCAGELFSFQRALSRILKKYIADGEKSEAECPICGSSDVYYKNGCPTCKICGNSNCA